MIDAFVKALLEYLIVFRISIQAVNTDQLLIGADGQTLEGVIVLDGYSYQVQGDESKWFDSFLYIYKQYLENQKTVKEHSDMEFLEKVVKAANENHIPVKRIEREITDKFFQYCVYIPEGSFNLFHQSLTNPDEHKEIISMYEIEDEPEFTDFVKALMGKYHRSFTPAIEPKQQEPVIDLKPKDIEYDGRIVVERDILKSELDKLGIDTEDLDFEILLDKESSVYCMNVSAKTWSVAIFAVQDETEFWGLLNLHNPLSLAKHIHNTIKNGEGDDVELSKTPVPEPKPEPKKRGRPKGSKNKTEPTENKGLQEQLEKALAQIDVLLKRIDELEKRLEEQEKPKEKKPRKKPEPKPIPPNPAFVLASKIMSQMSKIPDMPQNEIADLLVSVSNDFTVSVKFKNFGRYDIGKFDSLEEAHKFMVDGRANRKPTNDLMEKLKNRFANKIKKEQDSKDPNLINCDTYDSELYSMYMNAVVRKVGVHSKQEYEMLKAYSKIKPNKHISSMNSDHVSTLKKFIRDNTAPEFESPMTNLELLDFHLSYEYLLADCKNRNGSYSLWAGHMEEIVSCDKGATKAFRKWEDHPMLKMYQAERVKMVQFGAPVFDPSTLEEGIEIFTSHINAMYEDAKTKTPEITTQYNELISGAGDIVNRCDEFAVCNSFYELCNP